MRLTSDFKTFLKDTVNLDDGRLHGLETSSAALRSHLQSSDLGDLILGFEEQGSWAHDTIIRPVDKGEFDADLLVRMTPVEGWEAKTYLLELRRVLRLSPRYKRKVKLFSHCVTIVYANDKRVDLAPLIIGRTEGTMEVCNRLTNSFETSDPTRFTEWLVDQNRISGSNAFRKVTRLMKYLRDIKTRFVCSSVLLTTLLAQQVRDEDKDGDALADVPTAFQTLVGRLDEWLKARPNKPEVCNPFVEGEDFAASWNDAQYESFRTNVQRYRGWIDEAMAAGDRASSVTAWRKLFGEEFCKGEVVVAKAVSEGRFALVEPGRALAAAGRITLDLIDALKIHGLRALPRNYARMPHMTPTTWALDDDEEVEVVISATVGGGDRHRTSQLVASGQLLTAGHGIHFHAKSPDGSPLAHGYKVDWRVTNAPGTPQPRGGFYPSDTTHERVERLAYRGIHVVEAFVLRPGDRRLVGWSDPFFVAIE